MTINFDDFLKVDIRSGTITKVEINERAKKPAYKVWADFGSEIGIKQTSVQITYHYKTDELVGKQIMGCMNLGTKNIAGFISEFLLLGFEDQHEKIVIVTPERNIPNGKKLC
jgi:tRNA-binding protein